jgi:hypothetical protein
MKRFLTALVLASSIGFATAGEALAQVNYWSHPYAPYTYYGYQTGFYSTIRLSDPSSYLNGRQAPGTNFRAISSFWHGDSVYVTRGVTAGDGYTWYLVRRTRDNSQGWVRGDFLR